MSPNGSASMGPLARGVFFFFFFLFSFFFFFCSYIIIIIFKQLPLYILNPMPEAEICTEDSRVFFFFREFIKKYEYIDSTKLKLKIKKLILQYK